MSKPKNPFIAGNHLEWSRMTNKRKKIEKKIFFYPKKFRFLAQNGHFFSKMAIFKKTAKYKKNFEKSFFLLEMIKNGFKRQKSKKN